LNKFELEEKEKKIKSLFNRSGVFVFENDVTDGGNCLRFDFEFWPWTVVVIGISELNF
jgi:hypothetical protein